MESFPTELGVLTCLMILVASLWIPYIIGVNMHMPAEINPFQRPYDGAALPDWVMRARRAHLNLIEQGVPFAVLILILHEIDGFTSLTTWTAIAFFWLRIGHAAGMISGWTQMPLRPIIFTAGWVCCMILAYSVFAAR